MTENYWFLSYNDKESRTYTLTNQAKSDFLVFGHFRSTKINMLFNEVGLLK